MQNKVLLGKLVIGLISALLCALCTHQRIQGLPWRSYLGTAYGYLVLSRFAVFTSIYVFLGQRAQSDVAGVYYPQTRAIIHGLIPYKDFATSYAPLFSYVASLPVRLANSAVSIVFLAILFEIIAFPLWVAVAKRVTSPKTMRLVILCYVTSPLALINVAIDGQNQVWISCFLAAALLLYVERKSLGSGLALSLAIIVVKFLPVVVAPAFLIRDSRRWTFLAGFLVPSAAVYGAFLALGADVWSPITTQGSDHTSGNLPFLVSSIFSGASPADLSRALNGITVICLAAVYVLAWLKFRGDERPDCEALLVVLFILTVMLASKKSYTDFLVPFLFPLSLVVCSTGVTLRRVFAFGVFGILAAVEPSLWFRWLGQRDLRTALDSMHGSVGIAKLIFFVALDLVLVGFYAYYWWQTWRLLKVHSTKADMAPFVEGRLPAAHTSRPATF